MCNHLTNTWTGPNKKISVLICERGFQIDVVMSLAVAAIFVMVLHHFLRTITVQNKGLDEFLLKDLSLFTLSSLEGPVPWK